MSTYQYIDENEDDESNTRWIAARTQDAADLQAQRFGWVPCGGCIYDEEHTARMLLDVRGSGIDVVIP